MIGFWMRANRGGCLAKRVHAAVRGECNYTRRRGRDSSRVLGTAAFRQIARARKASNAWLRARNSGDAVRELNSSSSRAVIRRSASVMRGTMRAAFDSNRADIYARYQGCE